MQKKSMLGKEYIERLLAIAKTNLKRDGRLAPVLFFKFTGGERTTCLPDLPEGSAERQACFADLGASLHRAGKTICEAVFLAEGWFVDVKKTGAALTVAPSQHPQRQEAIVIIGRDASGERLSSVIQPFTRRGEDRPVWEKLAMASYNTTPETGLRTAGLLDCLFAANRAGRETYDTVRTAN